MPILNAVASRPDARDYKFLPSLAPRPNTDLRQYLPPVRDQESENACTSHQPVAVCESMTIRTGQYEELSEQFLYNVVGALEGLPAAAGRYSLRDNLEAVRRFGMARLNSKLVNIRLSTFSAQVPEIHWLACIPSPSPETAMTFVVGQHAISGERNTAMLVISCCHIPASAIFPKRGSSSNTATST